MKTQSPFICKLPFIYVSKDGSGASSKPCCRYKLDKKDYEDKDLKGSVERAFRSKTFEKIRNKMLKGEKLTGCQKCYDEEENGKKSYGRVQTELYSTFPSGVLKGLDISFSRECNLACRMCIPSLSTKWEFVWNRLYPQKKFYKAPSFELKDLISKEETLKNVEVLEVVGGEPFIDDSFYKFLDKLKNYDLSNKTIDVSTNCTFFPKQKYIDILLRFKNVKIGLSIDGVHQLGEYIRVYSKWSKVEQAADKWRELKEKAPPFTFELYSLTTVSAYNLHDLYSVFQWSQKKGIHWNHHIMYYPEYLQPRVLPEKLRHKMYEHYLQFPDFQNHLLKLKKHFIQKTSGKLEEFLEYTDRLDKVLGQDFFKVNPFYSREDTLTF